MQMELRERVRERERVSVKHRVPKPQTRGPIPYDYARLVASPPPDCYNESNCRREGGANETLLPPPELPRLYGPAYGGVRFVGVGYGRHRPGVPIAGGPNQIRSEEHTS